MTEIISRRDGEVPGFEWGDGGHRGEDSKGGNAKAMYEGKDGVFMYGNVFS